MRAETESVKEMADWLNLNDQDLTKTIFVAAERKLRQNQSSPVLDLFHV
jgi:hypothetical protein